MKQSGCSLAPDKQSKKYIRYTEHYESEKDMELFRYTPFGDTYLSYLDQPELSDKQKDELWWDTLNTSALPYMTRWVIFRALRGKRSLIW